MRTMVALFTLLICGPSWAQSEPCMEQDYSNPKKAPNWRCPGPDESILVPDLKFRPSLGIEAGSLVTEKGAKKPFRLDYSAVLLDQNKVLQLGLKIQGLRRLRWLERHKATERVEIEKKYMADRLKAQLDLEKSRVKVLEQQRDRARKERDKAKKWYRSWTFGLVVGIVTTAATVVAVGYAVK